MPKSFILTEQHDSLSDIIINQFKDIVKDVKVTSPKSGGMYSNITVELIPKKIEMDTLFGKEVVTNPSMYSTIQSLGKIVGSSETAREYKIEAVWFPHDVLVRFKIRKS